MRWLWSNWELKLVSLVVAVALWIYTSGQVRVERTVQIEILPAQIVDLPADLRVTAIAPAQFSVVVWVPTSRVDEIRDEILRPVLPLPSDRRHPGRLDFPITGRALGLASDIRILRTEPAELRSIAIDLAAMAQVSLPLKAPAVVGLPAGIVADVILDLTQADVRGAREQIERAADERRPLLFSPIRIDGIPADIAAPREERVELHPLPDQPEPVHPIHARVVIRPARSIDALLRVPVAVLLPPAAVGSWTVVGPEPAVELHLRGPEAVVRAIGASDVSAWIDLRTAEIAAGEVEHPVKLVLPAGVTAGPANVRLTLQPAH